MESSLLLAQALVQFLAFFMPGFVVMLVVEWLIGLFRHD